MLVTGQFVFDASPLILLARVGRLDLLNEGRVLIPRSVFSEIEAGSTVDDTARILQRKSHLTIVADVAVPAETRFWDLGRGETRVLSHGADSPELEAVLYDRAARRCPKSLGILTTGTLGLVLRGKKRGQLQEAHPVIEDLVAAGLYLSREVWELVLGEVGE